MNTPQVPQTPNASIKAQPQPETAAAPEASLSELLQQLLSKDHDLTVGRLFEDIGEKGFGLVLVLFSLPSALPVPAPGYSTPFGILLAILAVQMISGRHKPWLPQRMSKIQINKGMATKMLNGAASFFSRLENFVRPRWSWASGNAGHTFAGVIVLMMAILMIIPIPGTNTAPAGVIFLTGIALTEEDGLFLGLTSLLGILAAIFYAVILAVVFHYGVSGGGEALKVIQGWF